MHSLSSMGVLSTFASNHHHSHRQSHGKKLWSNLGFLKCNQDINRALDIFTKEKKERNVNKIHQISLENDLIIRKIKEMQDSKSVQSQYLT
jgi:hypothetical protein